MAKIVHSMTLRLLRTAGDEFPVEERTVIIRTGEVGSHEVQASVVGDDGEPYDLTGCTVQFQCDKSDGTSLFDNAEVTDAEGGKVSYTFGEEAATAVGFLQHAYFRITRGGFAADTQAIFVYVEEAAGNPELVKGSEAKALQTLLASITESWGEVQQVEQRVESRLQDLISTAPQAKRRSTAITFGSAFAPGTKKKLPAYLYETYSSIPFVSVQVDRVVWSDGTTTGGEGVSFEIVDVTTSDFRIVWHNLQPEGGPNVEKIYYQYYAVDFDGLSTADVVELADVRLGYDGITSATAGESVRRQMRKVIELGAVDSKRIENLEAAAKGVLYREDVDETEAYAKSVPAGAMPYGAVERIGGKTVAWNQQFTESGPYTSTITDTRQYFSPYIVMWKNGSIAAQYTLFGASQVPLGYNAKTFESSADADQIGLKHNGQSSDIWIAQRSKNAARIVSGHKYLFAIDVVSNDPTTAGGVKTNSIGLFDLTAMFGSGNEPTAEQFRAMFPDVYPYNAGELLSAEVERVESWGKNLLDESKLNIGYYNSNGTYDKTDTKYRHIVIDVNAGEKFTFSSDNAYWCAYCFNDASGAVINGNAAYSSTIAISVPQNAAKLIFSYGSSTTFETVTGAQLERGTTATAYSPYGIKGTLEIPQAVRDLPLYGASAGSVCNYIDWERRVYVQRVGAVDLGTLYWGYNADGAYFYSSSAFEQKKEGLSNVLTSEYATSNTMYVADMHDKEIRGNASTKFLYIKDSAYANGADLKSHLAGKTMLFELAEPIEHDLSSILSDDRLIATEGGGELRFKNSLGDSYRIPVPSTVRYAINVKEALNA